MYRNRTPHHQADGSLKNVKVLNLPVDTAIVPYFSLKSIENNQESIC
jgi:hypothetical protein